MGKVNLGEPLVPADCMKHRLIRATRTDSAGYSNKDRTTNTPMAALATLCRSVGRLSALCLSFLFAMLVAQACGGAESPDPTATIHVTTSPSAVSTHTPTPDATSTPEAAPSPSPTRADTPTPVATPTDEAPSAIATREAVPSPTPVPLSQPYYDPIDDFEILPPYGWAVDESGTPGARVTFQSTTPDLHEGTPFNANIIVVTVPAQGDALDDIVAASKEQLARTFSDFDLLGETFLIIDELEARGFEYTYSQGALPLRIIQIVAIQDDKIYVVSATALSAAWGKNEGAFDASLRSFRILDRPPSPTPTATATSTPTPTGTATPIPTPTSEPPTPTSTPGQVPPAPASPPESSGPPSPALLDRPFFDITAGFEVRPPHGWLADTSGLLETKVIFSGETPDLHGERPFAANIVVQVGPAHGFTLEQIVEESKKQSSLLLTDFDLLGDESVIVNGRKARLLDFRFVHGVFPLRSRQLIIVYQDQAYAITAGSLESAWREHEAALDASLRTFRVLYVDDSDGS